MPQEWPLVGTVAKRAINQYLRRYHRWTLQGRLITPDEPTLFVSHHGYGSVFDLNVYAALSFFDEIALTEPVTLLAHELAWTIGIGTFLEPFGARPASHESAREAFARGNHALVMPGGDVDGFKPHRDRNRIVFDHRTGFAQLAIDAGVAVVPIVTHGAGNTLFAVSDGRKLARLLQVDRLFRLKAIPTTISIPWGLNVGLVGFAPHLPLPATVTTRVLEPMRPEPLDTAATFAARVQAAMQTALTGLAENS